MKGIRYDFSGLVWQYNPPKGWYFVSLPMVVSEEIRTYFKQDEEGWGRLKATVKISNTEWKTAIWFDTKRGTYLLPLKAEIRKKLNIQVGADLTIALWV